MIIKKNTNIWGRGGKGEMFTYLGEKKTSVNESVILSSKREVMFQPGNYTLLYTLYNQ